MVSSFEELMKDERFALLDSLLFALSVAMMLMTPALMVVMLPKSTSIHTCTCTHMHTHIHTHAHTHTTHMHMYAHNAKYTRSLLFAKGWVLPD